MMAFSVHFMGRMFRQKKKTKCKKVAFLTTCLLNGDGMERYVAQCAVDIRSAFSKSMNVSPYQLLTLDGITVTVMADEINGGIYLFDSHCRNSDDFTDPNGYAVLLKFDTVDNAVAHLSTMYGCS